MKIEANNVVNIDKLAELIIFNQQDKVNDLYPSWNGYERLDDKTREEKGITDVVKI